MGGAHTPALLVSVARRSHLQSRVLDGAHDGVEVRIALTRQLPDDWRGIEG